MWNSFLSLWFKWLERFTKQGNPSTSVPSYLAGTTPPISNGRQTKSGSEKGSTDKTSSKRTVSQSSSIPKTSKSTSKRRGRPKGSRNKKGTKK